MNRRLLGLIVWLLLLVGSIVYLGAALSAQDIEQSGSTALPFHAHLIVADVTVVRPLTNASTTHAQQAIVPMSENFENNWPTNNSGWEVNDLSDNDGGQYFWGKRNCHPHGGSFGGWSAGGGTQGQNLPCSASYPNNLNSWAVYGPFDLSKATSATLSYHYWGSIEYNDIGCSADKFFVGSSTDGRSFSQGRYYCGYWANGDGVNGYYQDTIDLSSRLGSSQVWIGFSLQTNSSVGDIGIMIDDITLNIGGVATPTSTPTPIPTPTPRPTCTPPPSPPSAPSPQQCQAEGKWYAEYFGSIKPEGTPALIRCDKDIDFYWRTETPDCHIPENNFSVKWQRTVNFDQTGWYRFRTFTDDGVRLSIDGKRIIDDWNGHSFTENSALYQNTTSGGHQITMEYLEYINDAIAHLTWYRCPNGDSDCDMNIPAMYQKYYPNTAMPTTCTDWQNYSPRQNFFNYGCAVTSFAMVLQKYGVNTTPTELNEWLSGQHNAYTGQCDANLNFDYISAFAFYWGKQHNKTIFLRLKEAQTGDPYQLVRGGTPLVMKLPRGDGWHFFVAVDVAQKAGGAPTLGVNDPWSSYNCGFIQADGTIPCGSGQNNPPTNHATVLTDKDLANYQNFSYLEEVPTFLASLGFSSRGVELLLIDSQGRRTGFDPATGQLLREIPESMYFDSKVLPPGSAPDGKIYRNLILADNASGKYTLQIRGGSVFAASSLTDTMSSFSINAVGFDSQFITTTAELLGVVSPGQLIKYQVNFNPGSSLDIGNHVFLPLISKPE